jgi:hypothetical protein
MGMGEKKGPKKEEQLISELEEVIKQLREAQKETAATMTAEALLFPDLTAERERVVPAPAAKGKKRPGLLRRVLRRVIGKKMRLLLTVLVLAALAMGGWSAYTAVFQGPTRETFVSGVRDMATLATAEAYVMTTVEGKDNKLFGMDIAIDLPGTKRNYFIVIPAKLLAGVDLKNLSADDVQLDSGKKQVTITLPHATFVQESIQMDQVKMFTSEGLLRSPLSAKEGVDLLSQGQVMEKLRQEANAADVLKTAEGNAEKALQGLYKGLGYEVQVKFE